MARRRRIKRRRARQSLANRADSMDDSHPDTSETVITFHQWLKRNGFTNPTRLIIHHSSAYGYGLFTGKRPFAPGDIALSVPYKLLITATMLSKYKPSIYGHFTDSELLCLVVFLMTELDDPASPWVDYIEMLPEKYTSLPASWPPWDIKRSLATIPPTFRETLLSDGAQMTATYHRLRSVVVAQQADLFRIKADLLNWDLFEWAYCTVNTRCVYLPPPPARIRLPPNPAALTSRKDTLALIPFFDMLNHSADADVTLSYNPGTDELQLLTRKSISPYSQLFIKYNNYSNRQLLQHYGYTSIEEASFVHALHRNKFTDILLLKPSPQDLIPLPYASLSQWIAELESTLSLKTRTTSGVPLWSARLRVLCSIGFISPTDTFDLTWPCPESYFTRQALVKLRSNLQLLSTPPLVTGPAEALNLDWRLDRILQLMIRPTWDSDGAINRLIYADKPKGEYLFPTSTTSRYLGQYTQLWGDLLEWILLKDYGLRLDAGSSMEDYRAKVSHHQVRAVLVNEIGALTCLHYELMRRAPKTPEVEQVELNGDCECAKKMKGLKLK